MENYAISGGIPLFRGRGEHHCTLYPQPHCIDYTDASSVPDLIQW